MNHMHRVVWSESRQAFIVTNEKARTKGKPSSTRNAVASAVAIALAAMVAPSAMAAPCPAAVSGAISVSTATVTATCNLGPAESLTVTNTGQISATASAVAVNGVAATSITNSGSIVGSNNGIYLSTSSSVTGAITNNAAGTISSATGGSGAGIWLSSGSSVGSIVNDGTITGGRVGILLSANTGTSGGVGGFVAGTGDITNTGNISGGSVGIGLYSSANIGGGIVNTGTIAGNNVAIDIRSGSSITGSITNNVGGTIIGRTAASTGSGTGTGIYLNGGNIGGNIVNSGTITGGISLTNVSSVTGSITNNSGGTISRNGSSSAAVSLSGGSTVGSITNSGSITSNAYGLRLTSASSVTGAIINNAGGTISGASSNGILLSSGSSAGSISNSGTISGRNGAVWISGSTVGSVTNNIGGTISSTGQTGLRITNSSMITGNITNNGTISGINTGLYISNGSSVGGNVNNSGTISGSSGAGILLSNSTITGSLTNSGTISGVTTGIRLNSGSTIGSLTNSGTISGGVNAIYTPMSMISSINIDGNNTASFVGSVLTNATPMTILSGAIYTLKTTDNFHVASFTNNGIALFATGVSSFDLTNVTGNTFVNNGILAVTAGGTGTLTGNYTQAAAGTFRTDVTNDTSYGKLIVTGSATLPTNAKIDVNVANPNFAFTATSLTSILSATTLTWDGTSVVTDNSLLFDFTAVKNGNAVDLTLAAAATGPSFTTAVTSTGNTPGTGAATVLDTIIATNPTGPIGTLFVGLTTNQQVSDAVSQSLPLMTGGMAQATSNNLHGVNRVVQARQEENRGLSSGDGFITNGKAWVKPLGSWADQNNSNGAFGYKSQTYGVALGADTELSQAYRIGAAFAYTHSNVNSKSAAQSAGVDSYQFVLYGSNSLDQNTEINWQADYGYNKNKGNRYIAFAPRTALSDYSSGSFHVGAGIGRSIPMSDVTSFTPSFRADYTSIRDKGYVETGAGALNLIVNGKTADELILSVDGKVIHKVSDSGSVIGNLGLGYDLNAKQNAITASFAGGGAAFTTTGINPSATLVRGGVGYVANTAGGVEITARYDLEARSGFTGQTASVKARWAF